MVKSCTGDFCFEMCFLSGFLCFWTIVSVFITTKMKVLLGFWDLYDKMKEHSKWRASLLALEVFGVMFV